MNQVSYQQLNAEYSITVEQLKAKNLINEELQLEIEELKKQLASRESMEWEQRYRNQLQELEFSRSRLKILESQEG